MKENLTKGVKASEKLFWFTRVAALLMVMLMFFPAFAPTRVLAFISSGVSYFTSAISYSGLTKNLGTLGRDMMNVGGGAVPVLAIHIQLLQVFSILGIVGIAICGGGAGASLGNTKMKKLSTILSMVGSLFVGVSLALVIFIRDKMYDNAKAYDELAAAAGKTSDKLGEITGTIPYGFYVFLVLAIVVFVTSVVAFLLIPKSDKTVKYEMATKYKLFLILLPFLLLVFVFSYLPLWGWRYAFFHYEAGQPLDASRWAGTYYFTFLFKDAATRADVLKVLRNTLAMSGLGVATSWLPIAFAIMLNEIKTKWFKRVVQVFTTIPNFVSWVLVYSLAFALFSGDGFINSVFGLTGSHLEVTGPVNWLIMLAWGTWKGIGWSAIIYIAGISGIDPQLYEAATVDGASRGQKMWHITVPGLIPTFFVLLLMQIANILSNGMDQYLVFDNTSNREYLNVLDLYVYKLGIGSGNVALSTVISMTKSLVSVILLFIANGVSKLIRGESIM